jgi:hypothetical protein
MLIEDVIIPAHNKPADDNIRREHGFSTYSVENHKLGAGLRFPV